MCDLSTYVHIGDEDSFGNYPKKHLPTYYEMGPTGLGFNSWLARESHRSICLPIPWDCKCVP